MVVTLAVKRLRLTAVGLWGAALLALHVVLLFLPPLPPIHQGSSVPGYALSLVVTALIAIEIARQAPASIAGWRGAASAGLRASVAALLAAGLGLALAFRWTAPVLYERFSREEGLWEPLTVTCYLAGAILLWRAASAGPGGIRPHHAHKPWRLMAVVYIWLALEEVDYFGIFGGLFGRIGGVYAGSLHDVIRLTSFGLVSVVVWGILIAVGLLGAAILWRHGYLDPAWTVARLTDPRIVWALAGLVLLLIAALSDAEAFGWTFAQPSPEEVLELAGSAFLAVYALEEAGAPASG
jgi:hypothetical protein